jgi:hypothetical protein
MRRRTELLVGGALLAVVVVGAVFATGHLGTIGTVHLSPDRIALFAVLGGMLSVALAVRGSRQRRR